MLAHRLMVGEACHLGNLCVNKVYSLICYIFTDEEGKTISSHPHMYTCTWPFWL